MLSLHFCNNTLIFILFVYTRFNLTKGNLSVLCLICKYPTKKCRSLFLISEFILAIYPVVQFVLNIWSVLGGIGSAKFPAFFSPESFLTCLSLLLIYCVQFLAFASPTNCTRSSENNGPTITLFPCLSYICWRHYIVLLAESPLAGSALSTTLSTSIN